MSTNTSPAQWTFCDDVATVTKAVAALGPAGYIAVDCEGLSLGAAQGNLSLISLCAIRPAEGTVFLVDAQTLDAETLRPILDLLQAREPVKVMFDGRMDWSELYHRPGQRTRLTQVLDLQLADIGSRALRGEGLQDQLDRLGTFCYRNEVRNQQSSYRMVHRLNGLKDCAREHNVRGPAGGAKSGSFHSYWNMRPLPDIYLEYAATDAALIARLYVDFLRKGYINERELLEQSERYVSLHMAARPSPNSGHPLLPLEILAPPASRRGGLACLTCGRTLSGDCFSMASRSSGSRRNCWVCRAVDVRRELSSRWDDNDWDDPELEDYGLEDSWHEDDWDDYEFWDDYE